VCYHELVRLLTVSEQGRCTILQAKPLSELRNESSLSQRELAKALGLKYSSIAMYEAGKRTPSLNKAKMIAGFFSVPVEAIIFGNDAHNARTGLRLSAEDELAATAESANR